VWNHASKILPPTAPIDQEVSGGITTGNAFRDSAHTIWKRMKQVWADIKELSLCKVALNYIELRFLTGELYHELKHVLNACRWDTRNLLLGCTKKRIENVRNPPSNILVKSERSWEIIEREYLEPFVQMFKAQLDELKQERKTFRSFVVTG
jgi:hypothetical protein